MALPRLCSAASTLLLAAAVAMLVAPALGSSTCQMDGCGASGLGGCLKCTRASAESTQVTFYTDSCKCGDTISWISCRGAYTTSQGAAGLPGGNMPTANTCLVTSCDGSIQTARNNYNACIDMDAEAGSVTFTLPSKDHQYIYLQVHDGQLHNDNAVYSYYTGGKRVPDICSLEASSTLAKKHCSGGGGGSVGCADQYVCMLEYDISALCEISASAPANLGESCTPPPDSTSSASENEPVCTNECRAGFEDGDCGKAEDFGECAAVSCVTAPNTCTVCQFKRDTTKECRAAVPGGCDIAETCGGLETDASYDCPADAVQPSGTVCHTALATDPCDADDTCDGTTATCADAKQPSGTVCHTALATDLCDVDDTCDGQTNGCTDAKQPNGHVCRVQNGDCDAAETCNGNSVSCPADSVKAQGVHCRDAGPSACDKGEDFCDGVNKDCPQDLKQTGYTFKCGQDCFQCGVTKDDFSTVSVGGRRSLMQVKASNGVSSSTQGSKTGSGGGSGGTTDAPRYFGSIELGACSNYIQLETNGFPDCANMCIKALCPNNKGLSNIVFGQCNVATGKWQGILKYDMGTTISPNSFKLCLKYYEAQGHPGSETCSQAAGDCQCVTTEEITYMGETVTICKV